MTEWPVSAIVLPVETDTITVSEAGAETGTPPRTIRRWVALRVIDGRRTPEGVWLVSRASLRRHLEAEGILVGSPSLDGSPVSAAVAS